MSKTGTGVASRLVRPMRPDDSEAVATLFTRVFRPGAPAPHPDLVPYLDRLCFTAPGYSAETGSMVYDHPCTGLRSALLSIPFSFQFEDQPLTARLLSSFMADGREGQVGAARLSRYFRAPTQDLVFSDSASSVSADHWEMGGGCTLPIHSLEWRRVFRPMRAAALTVRQSLPAVGRALALAPWSLADHVLRRAKPALRVDMPQGHVVEIATAEEFRRPALQMLARFRLRPDWNEAEFSWLVDIARQNLRLGPLQFRLVRDAGGAILGGFVFGGQPGQRAEVFNILCHSGAEKNTVKAVLASLDAEGFALAVGMAQPFLLSALQRHRWLTLKHRGFFCIASRHEAVMQAIREGSFYAGGLASESWSRLHADF
ncbi:GNAT family N-acetyltransferase [Pannonibacter sp.]|uniref:GNAT family N-acetyltransferase n=1 Tax=Pannonibacter sp. TaxID=1906786 RepID=UPI003F7310C0